MSNFIKKCVTGDALLDDIDDYIDDWHRDGGGLSLYDFLGMTRNEYSLWVQDPSCLPFIDALSAWRRRGYRIGILSNSPWGTPPRAWHEELERHGLAERCDLALFCGEVGWRKPARPLFRAALDHFSCRPEDCLFIGDDRRWDVYGARRAGITPLLIDRAGTGAPGAQAALRSLADLEPVLHRWAGADKRCAGGAAPDAAGAGRA